MNRRKFNQVISAASVPLIIQSPIGFGNDDDIKVGIIGLDTSHVIAFTKTINNREDGKPGTGFMVTHAYPQGSKDIETSVSRVPEYITEIKKLGVKITSSIKEMLDQVDVVLLESNDGRVHLEQATEVFEAGKPVFIDKPIAADLEDAIAIFKAAEKYKVPMFSASSLRFGPATQAVAQGSIGKVLGADTYSPAKMEKTHSDLYWYAIHGVESLFTVMGSGIKEVRRVYRDSMEVSVGVWDSDRIGTFRGLRTAKAGYGGFAFGEEGIAPVGAYEGYDHLVWEILKFFKSGVPPVTAAETIEMFAFMTAAEESRKMGGKPILISDVMP